MNHQPVAKPNAVVQLGHTEVGNGKKLSIIAGPCQLESRAHAFDMAGALKEACDRHGVGLIYKTSFDKANRTSATSARGIGLENALPIFADIRKNFGVPVLTDVHERDQCAAVAQAVDVLQIPAFLSRQTDLLVAAARTDNRVPPLPAGRGAQVVVHAMLPALDKEAQRDRYAAPPNQSGRPPPARR